MIIITHIIDLINNNNYKKRYEEALNRIKKDNENNATFKNSIDAILSTYMDLYPAGNASEKLIKVLDAADLLRLDAGCWNDAYKLLGYLPPCPSCRAEMKYNEAADLLQCSHCGYKVEGSKYPYQNMPSRNEIKKTDYSYYEETTDEENH